MSTNNYNQVVKGESLNDLRAWQYQQVQESLVDLAPSLIIAGKLKKFEENVNNSKLEITAIK